MRILVIEDEIKIAKSIKQGLEQEGYAADIATSGDVGYDLASTEPLDLIILDLMLPKISGTEICKRLRSEENTTPIIMLTAKSEIEDRVNGLNCGADDYLTKPFSFEELLARIRSLLRRPKNYKDNVLTCGDLKMDTIKYSVTRNNKEIVLSKKEFALLEYFLRNKGNILTKEKIIEHVWDYDSDVLPNTVEVYVGYLRNKIDNQHSTKLLKTVRGFGYKIVEPNA